MNIIGKQTKKHIIGVVSGEKLNILVATVQPRSLIFIKHMKRLMTRFFFPFFFPGNDHEKRQEKKTIAIMITER